MIGWAASRRRPGGREHRVGAVRRLAQRVRAGGALEVGEAEPQHDRARHPLRLPEPAGHAVHERHQRRVHRLGRARPPSQRVLGADRAPPPAVLHSPRVLHDAPARAGAARRRGRAAPSMPEAALPPRSRTVWSPASWSFAAVTSPTPHSRSTGSGWRNSSSPVRRHHEQPVRLRHRARHLRQELRARDAHADRQPDLLAHPSPAAARRSPSACRRSAPCRARRGTPRRSRGPRRWARCPRRSRTPPCSPRHRPRSGTARRRHPGRAAAPAPAPIPRIHPASLCLIARGEHHARPDDHRAAEQRGVIPLLYGRVERVQVGVEDTCYRHERMFAVVSAGSRAPSSVTSARALGTQSSRESRTAEDSPCNALRAG